MIVVVYRVAGFDQLPSATGSAQLVLALTAAHWFNPLVDFYSEAERVLCPGGCLVVCGHYAEKFDVEHPAGPQMEKLFQEVRKPGFQELVHFW